MGAPPVQDNAAPCAEPLSTADYSYPPVRSNGRAFLRRLLKSLSSWTSCTPESRDSISPSFTTTQSSTVELHRRLICGR